MPGRSKTEFGRDARTWLVLQATVAQHAFDKYTLADQASSAGLRTVVRDLALPDRFSILRKFVVDHRLRRDQRPFRPFTRRLQRAKLQFEFARFGDRGVGAFEGAITESDAAPTGGHEYQKKARLPSA